MVSCTSTGTFHQKAKYIKRELSRTPRRRRRAARTYHSEGKSSGGESGEKLLYAYPIGEFANGVCETRACCTAPAKTLSRGK